MLSREENRVEVFPSSLRVESVKEAQERLAARKDLTDDRKKTLIAMVEALIQADPDEGISTDELMGIAGLNSAGVRAAMHDLEHLGLVTNDMALTAYVHAGVARSSKKRFEEARDLEVALIDFMREEALDRINLGFPGRYAHTHRIHRAIGKLQPGDELAVRTDRDPWETANLQGQVIGRLAKRYQPPGQIHSARVHAIVRWRRDDDKPEYRDNSRLDAWEVVVPELVFAGNTQ